MFSPNLDAYIFEYSPELPGDYIVEWVLGGLVRWDAHHFVSISQMGYTTESKFAFFPLYPYLIWLVGEYPLWMFAWVISPVYRAILAGWMVSTLFYSCSIAILYRLIYRLTSSQVAAYNATVAFMIVPANIFFTACYTESIYFCFFISGFYCLCKRTPQTWSATLFFLLASATRSNGIINIGFILHFTLHAMAVAFYKSSTSKFISALIRGIVQSACILLPYVSFQMYAWYRYCYSDELCAQSESLDCHTVEHPWCHATIPSIYSYIQVEYWENGLCNYWQLKKIPLFILAMPTVVTCIDAVGKSIKDLSPNTVLSDFFGFRSARGGLPWAGAPMQICCMVHLVVIATFAVLFMNVEVITRLVWSSSPLVFIYAAQIMQHPTGSSRRRFLVGYSFLYSTAGVLLHSNFYPWT